MGYPRRRRASLHRGCASHSRVEPFGPLRVIALTSGVFAVYSLFRAIVGLVVGLQRRVTGGILGPIITHLTWSQGMLFLLPHVLGAAG